MHVIGLTGGIGTGKSAVRGVLEELGAVVVDADRVGHEAYRPGAEAWTAVVDAFGDEILDQDGAIDRKKLGAIVFQDPEQLARLNAIMHPLMYRMMEERLASLREQGTRVAVLEAALLIEAKWTPLVDEVWVVHAPEDVVVERVRDRNRLSPEEVRKRIRSQMPQSERVAHADVLVENAGTEEDLRRQVRELWEQRVAGALEGNHDDTGDPRSATV